MLPSIQLDCPRRDESRHHSVLPDLELEIVRGTFPSQDNTLATTSRVAEVKVSGVVTHCQCVRPHARAEPIAEVGEAGTRQLDEVARAIEV